MADIFAQRAYGGESRAKAGDRFSELAYGSDKQAGLTIKQGKQLLKAKQEESELLSQLEAVGESPSTARKVFGPLLYLARQVSRPFFATTATLETMVKQAKGGDIDIKELGRSVKAGFLLEREVSPSEILEAAGVPELGKHRVPWVGFEFTGRGLIGLPLWVFADPLTYLPIVGWAAKGARVGATGARAVLPKAVTSQAVKAGMFAKDVGVGIFRPESTGIRGLDVIKGAHMEQSRIGAMQAQEVRTYIDDLISTTAKAHKVKIGKAERSQINNAVELSGAKPDAINALPPALREVAEKLNVLGRTLQEKLALGQKELGKEPVTLGGFFVAQKGKLTRQIETMLDKARIKYNLVTTTRYGMMRAEIKTLDRLADKITKNTATLDDLFSTLAFQRGALQSELKELSKLGQAGLIASKRLAKEGASLETEMLILGQQIRKRLDTPVIFGPPPPPPLKGGLSTTLRGLEKQPKFFGSFQELAEATKPNAFLPQAGKATILRTSLLNKLDKMLGRVENIKGLDLTMQNELMMGLRNAYKAAGFTPPAITAVQRGQRTLSFATKKATEGVKSGFESATEKSLQTLVRLQERLVGQKTIDVPDVGKMTLKELNNAIDHTKEFNYLAHILTDEAAAEVAKHLRKAGPFARRLYKDPVIWHRKFMSKDGLLSAEDVNEIVRTGGTAATGHIPLETKASFFETDPANIFTHEAKMVGKYHAQAEWAKQVRERFGIPERLAKLSPRGKELVEVPGVELFKGYRFRPEIAEAVGKFQSRVLNPKELGKLGRTYDGMLGWWKSFTLVLFPAYFSRNYVSQVLLARSDDIGWENFPQATAIQILSTLKAKVPSFLGGEIPVKVGNGAEIVNYHRIIDEGLKKGVLDNAWFVVEAGVGRLARKSINPLSRHGPLIRAGAQVAQSVDNSTRLAHFIGALKNPKVVANNLDEAINNAAARVRTFQFPYDDIMALSSIERDIVMRVVPFWRWTRFNLPAQVEKAVTNPKKLTGLEKLRVSFEGEERPEHIPNFIRDMVSIKIATDPDGFSRFLSLVNLDPRADLEMLFRPSKLVLSAGIGGPFTSVYEYLVNYNHFTGRKLEDPDVLEAGFTDLHPDSIVQDSINRALETAGIDEKIGKGELHILRSWFRALGVVDSIYSSITKRGLPNPPELAALRQAVGLNIFTTDEELEEYFSTMRRVRGQKAKLRQVEQRVEE
ncbi:MAG: hypothetical protein QMD05_06640 [Candidatus Brocadiaceae bacterium]|nr:hypothetical protein [Candidatus Brocadiaceae bacterium]